MKSSGSLMVSLIIIYLSILDVCDFPLLSTKHLTF